MVREQEEVLGKKRKREDDVDNDLYDITKQHIPDSRIRRKVQEVHNIKESGETFRAKHAAGDVKIHGKPDPYAFI